MKTLKNKMNALTLMILSLLVSFATFAQEGGGGGADINVDINKGGGEAGWYTSPWVWIVGAAIFILLLVALLRGNNARD
jgi:hypothetical protein